MLSRIGWSLVCAVVLLLLATATHAQPAADHRGAARELGKEGVQLYEAGEYDDALDRFDRAHKLVGLTTTGLWRARCLAKVGRLVEAYEQYLAVTRQKLGDDALPVHEDAQPTAAAELAELKPRIPKVTLELSAKVPKGVALILDGKTIPPALHGVQQPIDPGTHEVTAEGPGQKRGVLFTIREGETATVPVEIAPIPDSAPDGPPPPPDDGPPSPIEAVEQPADGSAQRAAAWVALGVGGAALVVGVITGVLATDTQGTLDDSCPDGNCPPDYHDDVDSFYTMRTVSTIGFITAGVGAIAGLTLALTAPPEPEPGPAEGTLRRRPSSVRLSTTLGPGGILLRGEF